MTFVALCSVLFASKIIYKSTLNKLANYRFEKKKNGRVFRSILRVVRHGIVSVHIRACRSEPWLHKRYGCTVSRPFFP